MINRRREKMSALIREEVSKVIDRDVDFPAGVLATVTRVYIAPDGQYATVFVSSLGQNPTDTVAILQRNIYSIQQTFNRAARMRPVPKITFAVDDETERYQAVERSLAELKRGA